MTPEVQTYLNEITKTENYLQLMKDLIASATGSDNELIWEKTKDFCEVEIVEDISFIVRVAKEAV